MGNETQLPQGQDVREIRLWLNKLRQDVSRLKARMAPPDRRPSGGTGGGSIPPMIAVVLADTDLIDIYRGEGDNEKKIFANLERNKEGVGEVDDWALRSSFEVVEGQRLLALKVRGVWECYMIVDGIAEGLDTDKVQVLQSGLEEEIEEVEVVTPGLRWVDLADLVGQYPILDPETVPDYALVRVDDGQGGYTVGWRAVTDDCETSEGA